MKRNRSSITGSFISKSHQRSYSSKKSFKIQQSHLPADQNTALLEYFSNHRQYWRWRWKRFFPLFKIFAATVIIATAIVIAGWYLSEIINNLFSVKFDANRLIPPNPEEDLPPSSSELYSYKKAAVYSDAKECSEIGSNILKYGNIIDATLATLFCNGLLTMQSMGIGGGFVMNLYVAKEKRAYTLNAREVAPLASSTTSEWYKNPKTTMEGPLSIATPGEVSGYWEMHKRFGSMPWADTIQPTIELCEKGFRMTKHMSDFLQPKLKDNFNFRHMFVDEKTGDFLKTGSLIRPPKVQCRLYRLLAQNGGEDFYNGTIADLVLADLREIGSIITKEDLQLYRAKWSDSIAIPFNKSLRTMYVTPPPTSGILLGFIMKILENYNFTSKSISTDNKKIQTYHRIIEAFKFAFAKRGQLGDPQFEQMDELLANLTSSNYTAKIFQKINNLNSTSNNESFYGEFSYLKGDNGTSHISIIAPNGDAVSVTSSLNFYFGSGISGPRTGIIFNSGIDDFSFPNQTNYFNLPASSTNLILPQKHAVTSMTPTIIVNRNTSNAEIIIGAAGGTKIPSSIAMVILRLIWFGNDLKQAIDAPRIHHQLHPMILEYEYGNTESIVDGLEKFGHKMKRYNNRGSIVCAIVRDNFTLTTIADYRKMGTVTGF